jgi:hypothetical protein
LSVVRLGSERCFGHHGFWGVLALACPDSGVAVSMSVNQSDLAGPMQRELLGTLALVMAQARGSQTP